MTAVHVNAALDIKHPSIKRSQKLILLALAKHAKKDGKAFVRSETVCEDALIARSSFFREMQKIKEMGLVFVCRTNKKNGHRGANIYILNYHAMKFLGTQKGSKIDILKSDLTVLYRGKK